MERKKREIQGDLPKRSDPNYMKHYYTKQRERLLIYQKEKRKEILLENPNYDREKYDPIKRADYMKKYRPRSSEIRWLRNGIVGMTYNKYLSELKNQNGKCKICKKEISKPHVDHDHKTGAYRGLLCTACNNGLGVYEKMKDKFEAYLSI